MNEWEGGVLRSGHSLRGVKLPSTHGYCPSQIYISSVYVLTTSSLYRATEYRI